MVLGLKVSPCLFLESLLQNLMMQETPPNYKSLPAPSMWLVSMRYEVVGIHVRLFVYASNLQCFREMQQIKILHVFMCVSAAVLFQRHKF